MAELGCPSSAIIGLTFTNKAAEQMRERVAGLIGQYRPDLALSTFHSLGARLLRRHAPRLSLPREFGILDEDDSLALIKETLKGRPGKGGLSAGEARDLISKAKAEGASPGDLAERGGDFEEVAACYARYEELKARISGVDFEDLILLPTRLLTEFPAVAAEIHAGLEHVLVDEYQDTSPSQYRFLRALVGPKRSVTCVGDPDQSIYRWRGADIRNILEFERDFPEALVVKLEQNYRSSGRILAAAAGLIAHNRQRKPKGLWTEKPDGPPLGFYQAMDEADEARAIGESIRQLVGQGNRPGDFAVLYRTHAQSRALEEAFALRGLPYVVVGGVKFYARREVKDMLAYVRLLANPADDMSLSRALTSPSRGVGGKTLAALKTFAEQRREPALAALNTEEFRARLPGRAREPVARFLELLNRMARTVAAQGFAAALSQAVEESGYLAWLDRSGPDAHDRRANLRELLAAAREAEEAGTGLMEFLERASLLAQIDRWAEAESLITLMTLHNAKGLEFNSVFIAGVEEGVLPHSSSLADPGELEEERRLLYVGITRAREWLVLSAARGRRLFERFQWGRNSRFLGEIPHDLLVSLTGSLSGPPAGILPRPVAKEPEYDFEGEPAFRRGETVRHERFGAGQVLSLFGSGSETRVLVNFPQYGRKTFLARMARLTRLDDSP